MKKTLLITWWTWYIWSHAVVDFYKNGYDVIILDNLSNSKIEVLDNIEKLIDYRPKFYNIDLLDKQKLEQVFQENHIDGVVHFAWLKAVWESCQFPIKYFQNNIAWSLNLFEIMEKYNVKNIIFSSSATVYNLQENDWELQGNAWKNDLFEIVWKDVVLKRWLKETDKTWNTTNPYGRTKYLLEQILEDLAKFSDFKVILLRYFNPIWAHKSGLLWENPNGIPNNLMPYIMKVLKWELKYLQVFWDDYPTKDGTWIRDYIDVNDLISWHIKAYNYLENMNKQIDVFNLWVWKWYSVLDMVKFTEKVSWKKINYKIKARRDGDLATVYCNPEKAEKILNWKAKTTIEESIENMIRFENNK